MTTPSLAGCFDELIKLGEVSPGEVRSAILKAEAKQGDAALDRLAEEPDMGVSHKTAAEEQESGNSHLGRNALIAGAGLAPFAGLIGQQKIIHDPLQSPQGTRFKNYDELSRAALPGDVLVTSKPEGSHWKRVISPIGGSDFYHAQPVVGKRGRSALTASAGEYADPAWRRQSAKSIKSSLNTVQEAAKEYPDLVLLRPKQGLTGSQQEQFSEKAILRTKQKYDKQKALGTWLKEIFVPKVEGLTNRGKQVTCDGNVCSTLPAQALQETTGRNVIPGKKAQDVFPTDFLRSKEYEMVGHRVSPATQKAYAARSPALNKAMPYLSRGAIGLGLAGGAYAASQDPDVVGGAAGALGASALASHLVKKRLGEEKALEALPTPFRAMAGKRELGRFATRTAPVLAAGGALGYLGAKKLRQAFSGSSPQDAKTAGIGPEASMTTSEYSARGLGGLGGFNLVSGLPNKPVPSLAGVVEKKADADGVSMGEEYYGPGRPHVLVSGLPPFRAPSLRGVLEKRANPFSILAPTGKTPGQLLSSAKRVGTSRHNEIKLPGGAPSIDTTVARFTPPAFKSPGMPKLERWGKPIAGATKATEGLNPKFVK